jgi:uncharacterized protein with GYD domain
MNTYIMLGNFTEQGIRGVKQAPDRIKAGRALAKQHGGDIKALYLAMGVYDVVIIAEFPDAEAAAKYALGVGATGNLRTTTLQVFPEEQYRSIAASLP